MDLAEYCRPQVYVFEYEERAGDTDEWDSYWGHVEACSEAEAEENASRLFGGYWWGMYREGPAEPERIGR